MARPRKKKRATPPPEPPELHAVPGVLAPILVAVFALCLYVPRLSPTLSLQGDSAVFVSAARMLGVPQPSGYPLWTVLAHGFSYLPFGEIPHRVHLLSAVSHAATVAVVCQLVRRLTGSLPAAVGAALALAFSRGFFQGSLYAEVFPLNDLFTALAVLLAVEIGLGDRERRDRMLLAFALLAGIASAHHQMIALTAPGLAVLLVKGGVHERLRDRVLLGGALVRFFSPILLFYGLIPFLARRQPRASWGDVASFDELVHLATRQDYGGVTSPHLGTAKVPWDASVAGWVAGIVRGFSWPLALVAGGFAALLAYEAWTARRRRALTLSLWLLVLVSGPIFAAMNGLEVEAEHGIAYAERFATMSCVPVAVLLGLALAAVPIRAWAVRAAPALGLVCVVPLALHATNVDLRADRRGIAYTHDLLRDVPEGSLVMLSGDPANGAQLWACGVERRCGQTIVFSPGQMHLPWRMRQLRRWYPELILPEPRKVVLPEGERTLVSTREIALANIAYRRVFVSTDILEREPGIQEAMQFLPHGIVVEAFVDPRVFADAKASFLARAGSMGAFERCEGCGMRRTDLPYPSLETSLPFAYALGFENHARVLRAFFAGDLAAGALATRFEGLAAAADPEGIARIRHK